MSTATMRDVARASGKDESDLIESVFKSVDPEHRSEFLRGLTDRIARAVDEKTPEALTELDRWITSWYISSRLVHDPNFVAADDEAEKLLAAGKLGPGITGKELRARYGR